MGTFKLLINVTPVEYDRTVNDDGIDRNGDETMITIPEMIAEIKNQREDIDKRMTEDKCPVFLRPLFEAGEWLGWRLRNEGASDEECERICFAMGQRVMMRGPGQSYQVAIESFQRWIDDRQDEPGLKLANDLIDGNAT